MVKKFGAPKFPLYIYVYKLKQNYMNQINLNLPEGVEETPELLKRCQLAILPETAEFHALHICQKYFNKEFNLGKYNSKGFDIISKDNSIRIEVKQTSCMGTKTDLSIGRTWVKKDICTHILILDYYNTPNRCSIIPQNKFFNTLFSKFHGKTKLWRWNKNYNIKNQPKNTSLFLKYEVKL